MVSPIGIMAQQEGEDVRLSTPADATSESYDPTTGDDFEPGAPRTKTVQGFQAMKLMREKLPTGCHLAITIYATSEPVPLVDNVTEVTWAGTKYRMHSARPRRYNRAIDGYTLFLTK